MPNLPLAGIRIADFSWVGAGPITTKFFSDFGADVIRIESGTRMDPVRVTPPFKDGKPGPDRSGYYADRNTNKRSITLNLKNSRGVELARSIISRSDVVVNNFSPGTMDRFGLGYRDVQSFKADIIYLSMSMQGESGPHHQFIGFGLTIGALAGLQYLSGPPDRPPVGSSTNYSDHVPNPCHGAFAVLAALRHRRRTGEGQFIDLAQTEPTMAVLGPALMEYTVNGRVQERQGNDHPRVAPHGVYPCRGEDRWIAIVAMDDLQWASLADALGHSEWLHDERWATSAGRCADRGGVDMALAAETSRRDADETLQLLQRSGVPAGVLRDARDLVERDPQLAHRGHWIRLDHPQMGTTVYNAPPYRFTRLCATPTRHAPLLGEHTNEVLSGLLGLSADEIASLARQGVLK
jgi:benzylsuccinate CoA-transferase BbsF subunit